MNNVVNIENKCIKIEKASNKSEAENHFELKRTPKRPRKWKFTENYQIIKKELSKCQTQDEATTKIPKTKTRGCPELTQLPERMINDSRNVDEGLQNRYIES